MSPPRPSIVVVPGAHHVPEHFAPTSSLLEKHGFRVTGVRLPSPDDNSLPPGFQGDLSTIRKTIEGELKLGHDVVLVVHSASGVTGPAAMKGLAKQAGSTEPGVLRIVAISAILAPPGQIAGSLLAGKCCRWRDIQDDRWVVFPYDQPGDAPTRPGTVTCSPVKALYNDMTEEQSRRAYDLTVPVYKDTLGVAADYAGWQDVPMTYVICEKDHALMPAVQEELIQYTGVKPTIRRLPASHSPFISMPDKVAELIVEAASQA